MKERWSEFGGEDSEENEGGSAKSAFAEMLVEEDKGGEPGEDGFEGEDECGVGGWEVLLGPALDGEGGCGAENGSDGEGLDDAAGEVEVGVSAEWEGQEQDEGAEADLKSAEEAGPGVGSGAVEGEQVGGEGDSAGEGEGFSDAKAGEDGCAGVGWRCEQDEAGEGEDCSAEDAEAGAGYAGATDSGECAEQRHDDDDETGDEGGL